MEYNDKKVWSESPEELTARDNLPDYRTPHDQGFGGFRDIPFQHQIGLQSLEILILNLEMLTLQKSQFRFTYFKCSITLVGSWL